MGMMRISIRDSAFVFGATLMMCIAAFFSLVPQVRGEPAEWFSNIGNLPEPRAYAAVFELDGKVAVVGGEIRGVEGTTPAAAKMLLYDPNTGETTYGRPMLQGVQYPAYVKGSDGKLYVAGGWNASSFQWVKKLQIYDPSNDTWYRGADAPTIMGACPAVDVGDGRLYFFGPVGSMNSTLIYDKSSNTWSYGRDQPATIWQRQAVVYNETAVFLIGGVTPTFSITDRVDVYNPVTATWSTVSPVPVPTRVGGAALGRNGYIYYFGGMDSRYPIGSPTGTIQRYDVVTDEWTVLPDLFVSPARAAFGATTDSYGRIFLVGGYDGSSVMDTVSELVVSDVVFDELRITAPSDGAIVSGEVAVTATLSNLRTSWPMGVDFLVDGQLVCTQTTWWGWLTWTWLWDTRGLADLSSHAVTVRAYLSDGRILEDSVVVTVSALSVEERLALLESGIAALESQLSAQGADINALRAQLDSMEEQLAALARESGANSSAIRDEIADLQQQLAALQEELDSVSTTADRTGTWGAVNMALIVVVLVIVALMLAMMRRKP